MNFTPEQADRLLASHADLAAGVHRLAAALEASNPAAQPATSQPAAAQPAAAQPAAAPYTAPAQTAPAGQQQAGPPEVNVNAPCPNVLSDRSVCNDSNYKTNQYGPYCFTCIADKTLSQGKVWRTTLPQRLVGIQYPVHQHG